MRTAVALLLLCVSLVFASSVADAQSPTANSGVTLSKMDLFNVIAPKEQSYKGDGEWPDAPVISWKTKLRILKVVSPESTADAALLTETALRPLARQIDQLSMPYFPGMEFHTEDARPNVVLFMGEDMPALIEGSALKELPLWHALFEKALAIGKNGDCVRVIGLARKTDIVAAVVFISPSESSASGCAASAFADILGLQGTARDGSVKSAGDLDSLQPIDEAALTILYGDAGRKNRDIENAIDAYLDQLQ